MESKHIRPGVYIAEELEARGWPVELLAERAGLDELRLLGVMLGITPVTPYVADGLGKALGTGAQLWINLEKAYRKMKEAEDAVSNVERQ